ncbi:hypothetical protein D3C76_1331620 [compost metagenome]
MLLNAPSLTLTEITLVPKAFAAGVISKVRNSPLPLIFSPLFGIKSVFEEVADTCRSSPSTSRTLKDRETDLFLSVVVFPIKPVSCFQVAPVIVPFLRGRPEVLIATFPSLLFANL